MPQGITKDQTKLVVAMEVTSNTKTGRVSATYVTQKSCPDSCPFQHSGCYAESGPLGMITRRLNKAAAMAGIDEMVIAEAEAAEVRKLTGKNPLRLHVVGDCRIPEAARLLAAAAASHKEKCNQPVWTYTHAWRDIARSDWGDISVLASCENLSDAATAQRAGYGTAVVVDEHPVDGRAWFDEESGQKVVPCPNQTRASVTCASCRLCFNADGLHRRGVTIAFAAHGARRNAILGSLSSSQTSTELTRTE